MPTPTFELLAISDRAALGIPFPEWLGRLAAAGVRAVQIREKDLDDRALYELARAARAVLQPPATVLVNGRVDLALAAGADGAHLPADGVPVAALRRRFGPPFDPIPLLGVSTHSVAEVERAMRDGADYVTFGPVWTTPSKERYGPPLGVAELAKAARVGIPVYALGGVMLSRFDEAAAAGAAGVAGIRLFQGSALDDVTAAARRSFAKG